MKFFAPALILSPLIAGIAFAQSEQRQEAADCSGPYAWKKEACKGVPITTQQRFSLEPAEEKPAPEYEYGNNGIGYGATVSFTKDETQEERTNRLDEFWNAGAVWSAPDKANIEKALVYSPPGTDKPIMRIIYKDMSEKERVPSYAERKLWTEARKENASLALLNLTYTLTDPPARPENPYPEFRRVPVDYTAAKKQENQVSESRKRLEESLGIPEERRGKDGKQCTETRDPDGSYSRHCSQTWSYSSSK